MTEKHVQVAGIERDYTFVTLDKPPEFHKVKWQSIDFSYSEIDHLRLFLSELRDCAFTGGTFRYWRSWGVRFMNCDFSESDLQNSNIGGAPYKGRDVEYINCHWRSGNMKSASLSDGKYRDCQFEAVTLANEQVINASFVRCIFSGSLTEIMFDGRDHKSTFPWRVRPDAFSECDLRNAALDDVEFIGIDTRSLRLPDHGQRIPRFVAVARRAFDWITTAELPPNEARYLEMCWKCHVTQLPDDAEGWLDLDSLDAHSRGLIEASIADGL
ncbi:pentapeptide repeat-containing protein [Mycobacterium sp. M1]|uniref:Pentapeptide repeat-containing protein n=1 Tax=Mycolicibacter acidiphilus TaxID=2835306 RepID=A0ABS5RPW8_9MYCO|nr:pentapeptide repeat-containing protein [Mycolicibacter acidiphilus]